MPIQVDSDKQELAKDDDATASTSEPENQSKQYGGFEPGGRYLLKQDKFVIIFLS